MRLYEQEEARWIRENKFAISQIIAGLAAVIPLEHDGYPITSVDYQAGNASPLPGLKAIPSYKAFKVDMVRLDNSPNNTGKEEK